MSKVVCGYKLQGDNYSTVLLVVFLTFDPP